MGPPGGANVPFTPQGHSQTYQFQVQTPAAMRQQLSKGPTRNVQRNKQRANAILFTPNRNRQSEQRAPTRRSPSSSPTPEGRVGSRSVFLDNAESDPQEPEAYIRRLNLNDPPARPHAPQGHPQSQPHSRFRDIAGPLHGRPGRKAPSRKRKVKSSDVWTFMSRSEDGMHKCCIFCQYVKIRIWLQ
jgi:hypothetical protein